VLDEMMTPFPTRDFRNTLTVNTAIFCCHLQEACCFISATKNEGKWYRL